MDVLSLALWKSIGVVANSALCNTEGFVYKKSYGSFFFNRVIFGSLNTD